MLAVVISVGHSLSLPQRKLFFFSQVYIGTFCKICTRMFMWPSFALPVRYGILGDLMKHACCKSKLCFKEGISCWLENLHVCPSARAAKDLFRCLLENHSRSGCGSRFATKLRMRSSVVYVVYICACVKDYAAMRNIFQNIFLGCKLADTVVIWTPMSSAFLFLPFFFLCECRKNIAIHVQQHLKFAWILSSATTFADDHIVKQGCGKKDRKE